MSSSLTDEYRMISEIENMIMSPRMTPKTIKMVEVNNLSPLEKNKKIEDNEFMESFNRSHTEYNEGTRWSDVISEEESPKERHTEISRKAWTGELPLSINPTRQVENVNTILNSMNNEQNEENEEKGNRLKDKKNFKLNKIQDKYVCYNKERRQYNSFEKKNDKSKLNMEYVNKYTNEEVVITDVDQEKNLYLYHYDTMKNIEEMNMENKNTRGTIRYGDEIVCKTFGYTPEYTTNQIDEIKSMMEGINIDECRIYEAEEGAIVRMYYYKEKWILSTHKKINAYKSKWPTQNVESYGELFERAVKNELNKTMEEFTKELDIGKTYSFLVRNNSKNRIVCVSSEKEKAYFIGEFDEEYKLLESNSTELKFPNKISYNTLDDVIDYIKNMNYKEKQGVIIYLPNGAQLKIINEEYMKYFTTRGNQASIKFRYLQLRNDKEEVRKLMELYPEYINTFAEYEKILNESAKRITTAYITRFIYKKEAIIPQNEYMIMSKCHNWHKENRGVNKISIHKVKDELNKQDAVVLNNIIKYYTINKQ